MFDSLPPPQPLSACHIRRATLSDRRQIRNLTRRLHQAAIPPQKWQGWLLCSFIGLTIVLFWQYPAIGVAFTVSSAPLWLIILAAVWITSHEKQQQYARYWVMDYAGQIIGCGRVDKHQQHSEIYDLFVLAEWRSCGVGQAIMQQLIAQATQPIYLASLPKAVSFYEQLGFKPIATQNLPTALAHRLSLNSPRYRRVGLQGMVLQSPIDGININ